MLMSAIRGNEFFIDFNSVGLSFLRKCSEELVSALGKPNFII